jgi:transcriptional regulator GlxA family with amidase domain
VEPDAIFVRDGPVVTSAEVTARIDLASALAEEDHGPDLARAVAKYMVVFLQRPGGQSQLASAGPSPRRVIRRFLDAVAADPAADHTLAAMAARVMVSERR